MLENIFDLPIDSALMYVIVYIHKHTKVGDYNMSKIYLGLKWTNHVKVANKGGTHRIRDEHYCEVVEKQDLLSRILSRVRRSHGNESLVVNTEFEEFHKLVKLAQKTGKTCGRTVMHGARKLITYEIKKFKIQFEQNGASYVVDDNNKIRHVGGDRPFYQAQSGVKVHKGLSESQAHAMGIKWEKHNHKEMMDSIFARGREIEADKLRKQGLSGGDLLDALNKRNQEKAKHRKGERVAKQSKLPSDIVKDDTPPWTPIENKPQSGMDKGKKQNKKLDKASAKPDNKAKPDNSAKPSDSAKPTGKPVKTGTVTFSKRELNECEKFKISPDLLPSEKPSGMNRKVWKSLQNKAAQK